MTRVLYNIKLYFSFLLASLKEILIYRVDCIVGVVSQIISQLVEIIFIWIAFQNTENLAGWNFKQVFLLYGITLIAIGIADFCFDALYDLGPKYIKQGEFDKIVLSYYGLFRNKYIYDIFISNYSNYFMDRCS